MAIEDCKNLKGEKKAIKKIVTRTLTMENYKPHIYICHYNWGYKEGTRFMGLCNMQTSIAPQSYTLYYLYEWHNLMWLFFFPLSGHCDQYLVSIAPHHVCTDRRSRASIRVAALCMHLWFIMALHAVFVVTLVSWWWTLLLHSVKRDNRTHWDLLIKKTSEMKEWCYL